MDELTQETEELIVEDDSVDAAEVIEPILQERRIFTSTSDPTINDLYHRFHDQDLILQPDFQRQFVWDNSKSSRLVESLLLDVPLPVIYLAEDDDGREAVIDGQQRLTSLIQFLDGKYALTGLRVRADLNGRRFVDLEKPLQGKIRKSSLRAITIRKESDKDLKFDIFERLNTGSVALNDQELRNCVYRGPYNTLLRDLASDKDFMALIGVDRPEKRMRDVELVLRFSAFYHATYLNYRPPMLRFLNRDMEKHQELPKQEAEELRAAFRRAVSINRSLLGKNAFKRFHRGNEKNPDGYWEQKRFNASLYDILMWGFTRYLELSRFQAHEERPARSVRGAVQSVDITQQPGGSRWISRSL
jgi:hypothetical protein